MFFFAIILRVYSYAQPKLMFNNFILCEYCNLIGWSTWR